jgi:hypothetical protein
MDNLIYKGWLRHYNSLKAHKCPRMKDGAYMQIEDPRVIEYIEHINRIHARITNYLNRHKYKMPPPLWKYDIYDETTWASSPKFAYGHLVKENN